MRFDRFTQPLPATEISFLTSGPDSQIYVGTFGDGFSIIKRDRVRTFNRADKLGDLRVSVILPVGNDQAWIGTLGGRLYFYQADALTEVGLGVLPGAAIYGLTITPAGVVWIGTDAGLFVLKNKQLTPYRPSRPIPFTNITDLAVTKSGVVFAGTTSGVLKISGDDWRSWTEKDGLPNDFVEVLATTGNDLWIGTSGGLAKLSAEKMEIEPDRTCPVFSLLPELDGGVWYGCEYVGGLHRKVYPLLRAFQMPKALVGAPIYSLVEDRSGAVWMASNRGLARWYNNKVILYTARNGLASDVVFGLSLAPDNSIWIATDRGFANINGGRIRTFHSLPKGSTDNIYSVLQDKSGTVWVGAERGLLCRRNRNAKLEKIAQIRSSVLSLREDSKGNIWVATEASGVFRLSAGSITQYGRESGLTTDAASDTLETANGDIWATTAGALVRIRDGRCTHIDNSNGLPAGRSQSILQDSQNRFWIRFQDGAFVASIDEINEVLDRGSGTISGRFVDGEDGSGEELYREAQASSMLRHSSGEIWLALDSGVTRVDPSMLSGERMPLVPKVLHVETDAGERDLSRRIVSNGADRNVRFSFSAPALAGAKHLEYRYRLMGFDEHWRKIGAGSPAMYTSLPPGNYRFEVSARRPYGLWGSASAPIDLQVLPRFYQTWWWNLLLATALLLTLCVLYKLRLAVLRKQFAALMTERLRERSRLAAELHDTVSRNLIGISAQLDAARVLSTKNPSAVGEHLDMVSRLAHDATKETRQSIFALRSRESSKINLLLILQQRIAEFSSSTSIQVIMDICDELPEWSDEVTHEVIRILDEALFNVRRHSLARQVVILARNTTDHLLLEIQDNGVGFQSPGIEGFTRGHFGVVGMKERAWRIGGKVLVQSTPDIGTKVTLQVPIHSNSNWSLSFRARLIAAKAKRYVNFGLESRERRPTDPRSSS